MSEVRQLLGPSQFAEKAAQKDEPIDVVGCRQPGSLRVQTGHPTKNMWITPQLIESTNIGMLSFEIDQEVADYSSVVPTGVRGERGGDGVEGASESGRKWMVGWSAA
jgi:hypothetical protein